LECQSLRFGLFPSSAPGGRAEVAEAVPNLEDAQLPEMIDALADIDRSAGIVRPGRQLEFRGTASPARHAHEVLLDFEVTGIGKRIFGCDRVRQRNGERSSDGLGDVDP
jgi:phage gp29-like protein